MQARKPAQDTLSHTGRMELCHFSAESQSLLQNYIDLMFERQTSSRVRPNIKYSIIDVITSSAKRFNSSFE